ncbi:MAG: 6-bladed beta-propeller [Balneolaceae bacterium]
MKNSKIEISGWSLLAGIGAPVLIVLLLVSCSSEVDLQPPQEFAGLENLTIYPLDKEEVSEVQFEPLASYAGDGGSSGFRIADIAVDSDRRVFIANSEINRIHVFSEDGSQLGLLGNEGSGPGQFLAIRKMDTDDENLYVYDTGLLAMQVFRLEDYRLTERFSLYLNVEEEEEFSQMRPSSFHLRSDGSFLVPFTPLFTADNQDDTLQAHFYPMNRDGELISVSTFSHEMAEYLFGEYEGNPVAMPSPYSGRSLLRVGNEDQIFANWTEDLLVRVYDSNGQYLRAFYHPLRKAALDSEELLERFQAEWQRFLILSYEAPAIWPVVQEMVIDDLNRIWIATITDEPTVYQWWVMDEYGEPLANFEWPVTRMVREVFGEDLYAEERIGPNESIVIRYRTEF